MNQKQAAASLVERARAGEQNAYATIVEIRKAAKNPKAKRHKVAKKAFDYIKEYIRKNPLKFNSRPLIGAEPVPKEILSSIHDTSETVPTLATVGQYPFGLLAAIVWLAAGPQLDNTRVGQIGDAFGYEIEGNMFAQGVRGEPLAVGFSPIAGACHCMGQCVREARGIQIVRNGGPVAYLSPLAAWELGE